MDRKILIVDDQPSNVRLLECTLRLGGFDSITTTTDPRTVAALHRDHHYDLILLDLVMPGMDGFQVMAGLAEIQEGGRLPVLVMSADPRQEVRAMQAGARAFMDKPFVLADVVARVSNLLGVAAGVPSRLAGGGAIRASAATSRSRSFREERSPSTVVTGRWPHRACKSAPDSRCAGNI